jgi:hypothetical protein
MERVISLSARIFRGFFFPGEVKEYTQYIFTVEFLSQKKQELV